MTHSVSIQYFPIAGSGFTISRETKRDAIVVHVALDDDGFKVQGECVPLKRYGHTPDAIKTEIEHWLKHYPLERQVLQRTLGAGPARFALDTALWQLEAARANKPLWQLAGLSEKPNDIPTAFTLSGAAPQTMVEQARKHTEFRWLKIKAMGDGQDAERIQRIHDAVPHIDLLVDANEALTIQSLERLLPLCVDNRVVLIEQPLPAGADDDLLGFQSPIPLAADETCHDLASLDKLAGKYQVANLKLDKTGGLTHALIMAARAKDTGLETMIGCMASTSLSIYPACMIVPQAKYIDLDGALLLESDRPHSKLTYRDGRIYLLD